MTEQPHILTQIRRAFTALLSDAVGEDHVHNYSSLGLGNFQSDQYPLALIAVTDTKRTDQEGGYDVRNVTVSVKLAERTSVKRPEEKIDEMALKIEKVMAKRPDDLGFGKFWSFEIGTLAPPEFELIHPTDPEKGVAIFSSLPISFVLHTYTNDPSRNFNP